MNNSRILIIKNAKPSGYYFYMNLNIWGDFQICISVPLTILPNCSVGATVAVDKYVNRSIYIFGFHDFLCFIFAYILGTLKCLITSGSIKSLDTRFFVFEGAVLIFLMYL